MGVSLYGGYRPATVVAGSAVINDTLMIEHGVAESPGYVAQTAIFCGNDMTGIFPGHCTAGIITMTFAAVVCSAGVVEGGVSKTNGIMAGTAIFRRGWMCGCFLPGADVGKVTVVA